MALRLISWVLLAGAMLPNLGFAQGGILTDPTRPPSVQPGSMGVDSVGSGGAQVQSIIIPAKGKPSAVINGERVVRGGKIGEDKVVRITDSEVTLDGPGGRQVLKLYPGVDMKMKKPLAAKTSDKKTRSAE